MPPAAIEKDFFYCRPCSVLPDDENKAWYLAVAVGRNVLSKMVADMCAEAHVSGKKTNHSLRVAVASCLFDAGVPERIIQARTGIVQLMHYVFTNVLLKSRI